ncbi:GNAT family N-acetyltransferase [Halalkalibacter sp. APA_J-10(15)]|uniref:GNAT family N-acetyltransferase n=1 Tax=unclassified Halalkalibacter TaxID=2893063 RepID=UPI001FF54548|nr:GNAT family protein [Halalkalibacter sp. APA_J-10(15)]MCK0473713.1 GNAT family N-acetyltransferase [Halalkalibacter sp. APA_J-10(15)]
MDIQLAPLDSQDKDLVCTLYNDENIIKNAVLGSWNPHSLEYASIRIERWNSDDQQQHFKIVYNGERVGLTQIYQMSPVNRKCVLGILILERFQRAGIGQNVLKTMINMCFQQLNLRKIEVSILSYNDQSIRLVERNQFKKEGALRKSVYKDGTYHDVYLYGLLKEECDEFK